MDGEVRGADEDLGPELRRDGGVVAVDAAQVRAQADLLPAHLADQPEPGAADLFEILIKVEKRKEPAAGTWLRGLLHLLLLLAGAQEQSLRRFHLCEVSPE